MRYIPGAVLFALFLGGSIAWGETFPGARGQTEAELLSTPVGRMAVPAGATLLSTEYEKAHWLSPGLISLYGQPPQLWCARVTRQYRAQDPRVVLDAVYAAARAAGFSGPPPELDGSHASFDHGRSHILVGWSSAVDRAHGYDRVTVVISDLPAPYGGECQGDRIGIYPTHIQY